MALAELVAVICTAIECFRAEQPPISTAGSRPTFESTRRNGSARREADAL
jgi:hypothetical protein